MTDGNADPPGRTTAPNADGGQGAAGAAPPLPVPLRQRRGVPAEPRQRDFGDFVIEREIGRGGMGVVWLAHQRSLGRRVALKALPNFAAMDADAVLRFRREAEATGRLAHPGIVPVYATGEVDGIHYFAMEFIDGPPLGTVLESLSLRQVDKLRESWVEEAQLLERYPSLREPPPTGAGNRYVRSCARLCADVANALAAAHHERVIHRDLKPNNILIHPAGRPVLVDFGLARDEQAITLTRSGEQIGTPSYMAPEQARGHRQIDARVDVYGLGAVLYELLTLRPPFEGTTSAEIAHQILTESPVPVHRRNPNVPVDLAAIVHRCLAKAPDDRYPVIEALELDLRNFLAGRAVDAALPNAWARLHGAMQRQRQSLVIGAAAALAATLLAFGAGFVGDRGDVAAGRDALVAAGRMLVDERDPARARDLYERAAALTKQPDEVREQRRSDFRRAFATLYEDKPHGPDVLRRFATVFDAVDRAALRTELARLEGRGALRMQSRILEQETATLQARLVTPDGLQQEWHAVRLREPLPVGEYLLRATSVAGSVAYVRAAVGADSEVEIVPRYLGHDELPEGYAAVRDPLVDRTIAIANAEVTRAQWRAWLATIADTAVRAELMPLQWDGGERDGELPVRGLSFWQARAFAAAHGAHLPTVHEQWLAGSAGLQGLRTPWGSAMDRARIAADPYQLSQPLAVTALPEGRSPLGVHHVLGNVAEILSAVDGRLRQGGGSFADEPAALFLDGAQMAVPTAALLAIDRGQATSGMRLYTFVAPLDDSRAAAAAAARREDLRSRGAGPGVGAGCHFHDWRLDRDGSLSLRLEINGVRGVDERLPDVHFDTPGFLQLAGSVRALDGHDRNLEARITTDPGGEHTIVQTALPSPLRQGQGYRYYVEARLAPLAGLLPQRDGYLLRLPIARGYGVAKVYALDLPADCAVEDIAPPATIWTVGGRTVLAWEQTAAEQIETAVVRLRLDGALGSAPVGRLAAEKRCRDFLAVWNDHADRLDDLLDRDFVRQPGAQNRAAVLARASGEQLALRSLDDVVRIGDIETMELTVDWRMRDRDGRDFELLGWPFVLQWRHDVWGARVVRLHPVTRTDQGRFDSAAGYVQQGRMRVRIALPAETTLKRTQDELCELQVVMQRDLLRAQVVGCFADADETPDAIRFQLTNGASVLRAGRLLATANVEGSLVESWEFEAADGQSVREQLVFQQRGSRHLLIRCFVETRDKQQANAVFASAVAAEWFAAVQQAVHID